MQNFNQYKIIHGKQVGRKIGFPTINLSPPQISPPVDYGVYACEVTFLSDQKTFSGVLFYGHKTENQKSVLALEVYLLKFNQTVYQQDISLKLGQKIRDPQKFDSLKKLQAQIKLDIQVCKQM